MSIDCLTRENSLKDITLVRQRFFMFQFFQDLVSFNSIIIFQGIKNDEINLGQTNFTQNKTFILLVDLLFFSNNCFIWVILKNKCTLFYNC